MEPWLKFDGDDAESTTDSAQFTELANPHVQQMERRLLRMQSCGASLPSLIVTGGAGHVDCPFDGAQNDSLLAGMEDRSDGTNSTTQPRKKCCCFCCC